IASLDGIASPRSLSLRGAAQRSNLDRRCFIARFLGQSRVRGCGMAFLLIDDEAGAVPVGFAGEAGKLALVPDEQGRLGRVLAGTGDDEAAIWAAAALPEALPP